MPSGGGSAGGGGGGGEFDGGYSFKGTSSYGGGHGNGVRYSQSSGVSYRRSYGGNQSGSGGFFLILLSTMHDTNKVLKTISIDDLYQIHIYKSTKATRYNIFSPVVVPVFPLPGSLKPPPCQAMMVEDPLLSARS